VGLTGKYAKAVDAHRRALELCRGARDRIGQATALNDLGRALCQTGDLNGARRAQSRALELYESVGHRLVRPTPSTIWAASASGRGTIRLRPRRMSGR